MKHAFHHWNFSLFSLIEGDELNESAILENLATHKLLLSRNPSSKDLEDLCLNIFENYTAIQLEIARHNPLFAVVSNVWYAPFLSQLMYMLRRRDMDLFISLKVSPVEHRWGLPGYSAPNFLRCSGNVRPTTLPCSFGRTIINKQISLKSA